MRRLLVWTAIAVAGLTAAAPAAATDPPQTYVLPVCRTANGAPHPLAGWTRLPGREVGTFDTCAVGGGFGSYRPLFLEGEWAAWDFVAPADVRVVGLRIWRHGTLTPGYGRYQLAASGPSFFRELETEAGLTAASTLAEYTGLDADEFYTVVYCHDIEPCGPDPTQNRVTFTRMEMVLRDASPPRAVGVPAGSALGPGSLTGVAALATEFADAGGGLREAAILVDGAEAGRAAMRCPQPYTSAAPCPRSGRAEVGFDTRTVPNGAHRVQLALIDVAGNRTLTAAVDIDVRNPVEALPDLPLPTTRPGTLSVAKKELRGRHNRSVAVAATLRDAARAPITGAPVTVEVRTAVRGSKYVAAPSVNSDDKGRVTLQLPPGPSRFVRLTYGASSTTVALRVRAPLRLAVEPKSMRNGGVIRLTGSVAGTKVRHRVELQAFSGGHWFPFRTVRLRDGKFSGRYRFTRTFRTTRYRFRAVVRADADFPYAAGTSKVVAVRVTP